MIRTITLFIGLLFFFCASSAQQASFTASTDARKILENSYVNVAFELKNFDGVNFTLPPLKDFDVIGSPNRSTSFSNINGRSTSSLTLNYTLRPKRLGYLRIEPASVTDKATGNVLKTKTLIVEVVKAKKVSGSDSGQDYFIKSSLLDSSVFVGQRTILKYDLYYKLNVDIKHISIRSEDPFTDFEMERIEDRSNNQRTREIIDGVEYFKKTIAQNSLIPKIDGRKRIASTEFILKFPDRSRQNNGFLFSRTISKSVLTEELFLDVKPTPLNRPAEFADVIGRYTIQSTINKQRVKVGDALTLRVNIQGDGNGKNLIPPKYSFDDALDVYDPSLIKQQQFFKSGRLYHLHTYEYLIVPNAVANYTITPTLNYFDVDSARFVTIQSRVHNIRVSQDADASKLEDKTSIQQAAQQLAPIQLESKLSRIRPSFFMSGIYWGILSLIILVIGLMFLKKYFDIQKDNEDPELKKSRLAKKLAIQKLATAKGYLEQKDYKTFYKEISEALLGFVSDKLKIPPSEITKSNVHEKLKSLEIDEETSTQFIALLKDAEMALYAGGYVPEKVMDCYDLAIQNISTIEMHVSKLDGK